jgi:DNA-binding transcriptional regulator YbjK
MARRDPPVRHTEQDISEAALKLFCERGYHAVTVEEIVSAAGVTKGAFYYFADKEDLASPTRRTWPKTSGRSCGDAWPRRPARCSRRQLPWPPT